MSNQPSSLPGRAICDLLRLAVNGLQNNTEIYAIDSNEILFCHLRQRRNPLKEHRMNDLLTKERLETLMNTEGDHLVSVYMPAHRLPNEAEQDPIRLRNLLTEAEEQLKQRGMRTPVVRDLLQPAHALLGNSAFWRHQSDGLALFLAPDEAHVLRLPLRFRELVVVGDYWHVKALLPLFAGDGRFYILALSQKAVRLLEGTRYSVSELELENIPTSLAEALRFDDPESQLQFHTSTGPPGGGPRRAIFHGHGVGKDDEKSDLLRYFHQIDHGLGEILRNERAPLVLAGVDYLLPIYRETNEYRWLLDEVLTGNYDDLRPEELHAEAWPLVEPVFAAQREQAKTRFHELSSSGQATTDLKQIVEVAHHGRIDTLFVPLGQRQWGRYDPSSGRVELYADHQPGARDLLDLAAVQTYLNGGVVFAVEPAEMPDAAAVAAILRY